MNDARVPDSPRTLDSIEGPYSLTHGATFCSTTACDWRVTVPIRYGYDFHWLREVAVGVLRGVTGLRLDAGVEARVSASFSGCHELIVTREGEALRVLLRGSGAQSQRMTARAEVKLDAALPRVRVTDALMQALLGTHALEWLRGLFAESGSARWSRVATTCGVQPQLLDHLANLWREFTPSTEDPLWRAADEGVLDSMRKWAEILAEETSSMEFMRERFAAERAHLPGAVLDWVVTLLEGSDRAAARAAAFSVRRLLHDESATGLLPLLARAARDDISERVPSTWVFGRLLECEAMSKWAEWRSLGEKLWTQARAALEQQLRAGATMALESGSSSAALADARFDGSPAGCEAFRRVVRGDLAPIFAPGTPGVIVSSGTLVEELRRKRHIEIHLPFLDRKMWQARSEVMSRVEIRTDAARVTVVNLMASDSSCSLSRHESVLLLSGGISVRDGQPLNDVLTLAFADRREFDEHGAGPAYRALLSGYGIDAPLEGAGAAVLRVKTSGAFAAAWSESPHSRDQNFVHAFARVSRRVQTLVRRWLPALYFADIDRLDDLGSAYCLLAYAASAPYTGKRKGSLAYDVMDANLLRRAYASSARGLAPLLRAQAARLAAAGRGRRAAYYSPDLAGRILAQVCRQRRNFESLLSADAFFIEELIQLAGSAREIRQTFRFDTPRAVRRLSDESAEMVKSFRSRLKRLYGGSEFLALGPLILIEATAALADTPPCRLEVELEFTGDRGTRVWRA